MEATIVQTIYKDFNDWDSETQEKILCENRYFNTESGTEWCECSIEDFKEAGSKFGIDVDNIYFSGFSSQGDGACFTGDYSYKIGALKTIKTEYPKWLELHEIVKRLQDLQRRYCYRLNASITHHGRYYHENCAYVTTNHNNDYDIPEDTQDEMTSILRDFMRLIYSTLEKEYDYLTSNEALTEYFNDSDYQFNAEGKPMC
jgi:hypothetical protein